MKEKKDVDAFYKRLKEQLEESTTWPSKYLYKFIIPSEEKKIAQIEDVFDNTGAVINTKKSSNGKYTSISVEVILKGPNEVIEKYKQVGKVEGVISL